ncbi:MULTISPECIES: Rrf2 family transcriptional regulator [Paenibacillus]|uniref:Rrf2 family transcriptional regulator n=1 Tax=Paenibacillus TaxID=44249 RepID=UPI002FDF4046
MNSEFTIAVHCLLFLYTKEDKMANSEQIACSVSTHPARVRKVLSLLRKQGLVATKEGARGGYQLNKTLEEITLGDLYRLFARGSLQPGWCSGNEKSPCQVSSNIHSAMELIFNRGEDCLESYFNGIALSEVHRLLNRSSPEEAGDRIERGAKREHECWELKEN